MLQPGPAHRSPARPDAVVALVVDLDGTLVATDTLVASLRVLARRNPLALLALPFHVLRGRAAFKHRVAQSACVDCARLPYRRSVIDYIVAQRRAGRRIVLATAAHGRIAQGVADHLPLFDDVISSDRAANVKGGDKVSAIRRLLGDAPFDYMGDSMADVPVFRAARRALLVGASARVRQIVEADCVVEGVFE
jgi:phosphoserine phosphatase